MCKSCFNRIKRHINFLIIEAAEEADGRPGGFIGYVPEIPGANTQGETEEEVRQNIVEAIQLIQEVRKEEEIK